MRKPTNIDKDAEEGPKSKSQIKREFKALQELGKQLVELPLKQIDSIPLSDEMKDLVVEAQSLKHGTLNRQFRLIGSRMPDEDVDSIHLALNKLQQPQKKAVVELHEMEQWRDRLLQSDQTVFDELAKQFEGIDRQYVNQMIRNAKKELDLSKPPKSSRLLFKYLSELKGLS